MSTPPVPGDKLLNATPYAIVNKIVKNQLEFIEEKKRNQQFRRM